MKPPATNKQTLLLGKLPRQPRNPVVSEFNGKRRLMKVFLRRQMLAVMARGQSGDLHAKGLLRTVHQAPRRSMLPTSRLSIPMIRYTTLRVIAFTDFTIAKGALRGIQSDFCIYCSSSNPSIRHQETCGTWRTSKRSWIWLCDFR